MSTTREERATPIHQVVFRWTNHHLLGGRGIGPVGTSLDERGLARWSDLLDNGDLVGTVRPECPALGLLRFRSRPGHAVLVRADAVPTSTRGSHQLHALVGRADTLNARTALGLLRWDGWLAPDDGPLTEPRLPALDADTLNAAVTPPGPPDTEEVAALVRHVLHRPDRHFHFAGADSDPYALAFAAASVLDVSLIVEGDVRAVAAQPRIAVTRDKTTLHIPPSKWSRKVPGNRAPLAEQAADVADRIDAALAAPHRDGPQTPEALVRWIAGLRFRRDGAYALLRRVVDGDTEAAAHLAQADTLRWLHRELPGVDTDALTEVCSCWGHECADDPDVTALLRDEATGRALDWTDTPQHRALREAAEGLFTLPAPVGVAPKRRDELQVVHERLAVLYGQRPGRSATDAVTLLWQAFTLARLSEEELGEFVEEWDIPIGALILAIHRFTHDPEADRFRRALLAALRLRPRTADQRRAVREALVGTDFLLDALAAEELDHRQELFGHLLLCGYGPAEENRHDRDRAKQLHRDLRGASAHPGFRFVLPEVAHALGSVRVRLDLWHDLHGTPSAQAAGVLLEGAAEHTMERLAYANTLAEFRTLVERLVELRRADALPVGPFARLCEDYFYFQERLYGFRRADAQRARSHDIVRTFADLVWLTYGEEPDPDHAYRLPESDLRELEWREQYPDPPFFRLALIRLARTRGGPTPASERLWRSLPAVWRRKARPGTMLHGVVGQPPSDGSEYDHAPTTVPAQAEPRRAWWQRSHRVSGEAPPLPDETAPRHGDSPDPTGAGADHDTARPPKRRGLLRRLGRRRRSPEEHAVSQHEDDDGWDDDADDTVTQWDNGGPSPHSDSDGPDTEHEEPSPYPPGWNESQVYGTDRDFEEKVSPPVGEPGPFRYPKHEGRDLGGPLLAIVIIVAILFVGGLFTVGLFLINRDLPDPPPVPETTVSVEAPPN